MANNSQRAGLTQNTCYQNAYDCGQQQHAGKGLHIRPSSEIEIERALTASVTASSVHTKYLVQNNL